MKKTLYYAANGTGQCCVFAGRPVRDENRKVWMGEIVPCFALVVMQLESEGLALPNISWKDDAVKIGLDVEIEK